MRVFVTGATGFVGSFIVLELIGAGHEVVGLTRSDAGAEALTRVGAKVLRGDVNDPETLRAGAEEADGVIHAAFDHDTANQKQHSENDRKVIAALGAALAGLGRPLVITSGTGLVQSAAGQPAREQGRVAFIGEGRNRVPAAHVSDVARLYRLALENGEAGACYHAVAEEGILLREIAEAIGAGLGLPVESITPAEAPGYYGWLARLAELDLPASGTLTRQQLSWNPSGPDLLADLREADYDAV
ncbi:MAG TPA: NAD-dependent epimerase/dehydratase family protein [Trebonia sp.]